MNRLDRYALAKTNGRLDALGIVLFLVFAAFFAGLVLEMFAGHPR